MFCFRLSTPSLIQNVNNILEKHDNLNIIFAIFLYQFYFPRALWVRGLRKVII